MRYKVLRQNDYGSFDNPLDAIRSGLDPRRSAEAKRLGQGIKGAKVVGMDANRRRVVLTFDNGLALCLEPTPDGAVAWSLQPGGGPAAAGTDGEELPASGEMEFLLPSGVDYTWRWRAIRERILGSTVVMCSAERHAFNLHCREEVEVEFDVWTFEQSGAPQELLIFMPF